MKNKCSYCGKILTNKHTFSYGIPGIKRVFGCSRWWCRWLRQRYRVELGLCSSFCIGVFWDQLEQQLYIFLLGLHVKIDTLPTFPDRMSTP